MKKHDRALKAKGFRQVSPKVDGAIVTVTTLKCSKYREEVKPRTITRGWMKLRNVKQT